jgi:hypothetical protein
LILLAQLLHTLLLKYRTGTGNNDTWSGIVLALCCAKLGDQIENPDVLLPFRRSGVR